MAYSIFHCPVDKFNRIDENVLRGSSAYLYHTLRVGGDGGMIYSRLIKLSYTHKSLDWAACRQLYKTEGNANQMDAADVPHVL